MSELLSKGGADSSAEAAEYVEPEHLDLERWRIGRGSWEYAQAVWRLCMEQAKQGHFVDEKLRQRSDVTPVLRRVLNGVSGMIGVPSDNKKLRLILEEMIINAVRGRDPGGNPVDGGFQPAVLQYGVTPSKDEMDRKHRLLVVTEDEGKGFNLLAVPNPLHKKYIERQNGRGIQLMGYNMSVRDGNFGGRVVYLPQVPSVSDNLFMTRKLTLEFPLDGEYEDLQKKFFTWRNSETWHPTSSLEDQSIEASEEDADGKVRVPQVAIA